MDTRRPCPCCGHLVFDIVDGWPGSFDICSICFWEDDAQQFRWPFMPGGANCVSLVEAQRNFQAYGACDQHGRGFARPPADHERLDPHWRPIDPAVDFFEDWRSDAHRPWPAASSVLCWWLASFWGPGGEPQSDMPHSVVIDVGAVGSDRDLHDALRRELGFPPFYGMNWAAFWDAITGLVEMPRLLRFVHWAELERRAPQSATALREQLARYGETNRVFSVIYDQ
ncbi:CPCC family cysteine-rich protein [Streptomyces sp. NPDC058620]|uniref:CPCC family cysteine-rich protein n=1 Tax=Streptomyces sp. NPDC058620 TaxID=3346560 RepID=UPI00365B4969